MNKDLRDIIEQKESDPLFKKLGISNYVKTEGPDFTFVFEGKVIGLEHTKGQPNGKSIERNKWREIHNAICDKLNTYNLPPYLFTYSVKTHEHGKNNINAIAEEILRGYQYMLANNVNSINIDNDFEFQFDKLTYLSYFQNIASENVCLSEMTGGVEYEAEMKSLESAVEKKEIKLESYKKEIKNSNIQEYWLIIYVPVYEYCSIKCDHSFFKNSTFDRIYVMNGRYDNFMDNTMDGLCRLK